MTTYYDSAEGMVISKKRAINEVVKHSCSVEDFLVEVGDKLEYDAQEVLRWLGY